MSKVEDPLGDLTSGFFGDAKSVRDGIEIEQSLRNIISFLNTVDGNYLTKLMKTNPEEFRSFYLALAKLVEAGGNMLNDPNISPTIKMLLGQMILLAKMVMFMMEMTAKQHLKEKPVYM